MARAASMIGTLEASGLMRTMTERLEDLQKRKEQARHAGSERDVERQHSRGKMTARERVEYLLDDGSFHELDQLARHRSTAFGLENKRQQAEVAALVASLEGSSEHPLGDAIVRHRHQRRERFQVSVAAAAGVDAARLVVSHGGSLSGEHGDGQSRAELLPRISSAFWTWISSKYQPTPD